MAIEVETETIAIEKKPEALKPGYKTTEFWFSLAAAIVGLILASGALPDGGQATQIIGGIAAILAQLGYTSSRIKAKS